MAKKKRTKSKRSLPNAISLFSGAIGTGLRIEEAGFQTRVVVEINKAMIPTEKDGKGKAGHDAQVIYVEHYAQYRNCYIQNSISRQLLKVSNAHMRDKANRILGMVEAVCGTVQY